MGSDASGSSQRKRPVVPAGRDELRRHLAELRADAGHHAGLQELVDEPLEQVEAAVPEKHLLLRDAGRTEPIQDRLLETHFDGVRRVAIEPMDVELTKGAGHARRQVEFEDARSRSR